MNSEVNKAPWKCEEGVNKKGNILEDEIIGSSSIWILNKGGIKEADLGTMLFLADVENLKNTSMQN
jgi:hypothetical protein